MFLASYWKARWKCWWHQHLLVLCELLMRTAFAALLVPPDTTYLQAKWLTWVKSVMCMSSFFFFIVNFSSSQSSSSSSSSHILTWACAVNWTLKSNYYLINSFFDYYFESSGVNFSCLFMTVDCHVQMADCIVPVWKSVGVLLVWKNSKLIRKWMCLRTFIQFFFFLFFLPIFLCSFSCSLIVMRLQSCIP